MGERKLSEKAVSWYRTQPAMGLLGDISYLALAFISWYSIDLAGYNPSQNVYIQLLSVWVLFMWVSAGFWPIGGLGQPAKGILVAAGCMVGGFLHYHIFSAIGIPDEHMFPWLAGFFFWLVLTDYCFDNLHVKDASLPDRMFTNLMIWYFGTYVSVFLYSATGIPGLWFPFAQWCLGCYWRGPDFLKNVKQPAKGVLRMTFLFFICFMAFFFVINVVVYVLGLDPTKYAAWLPYPCSKWGPGWDVGATGGGWWFWPYLSWFAGWGFATYHYWQNPWHKWFGHTKGSLFALIMKAIWVVIWTSILFALSGIMVPAKYAGTEWLVIYSMGWVAVNWEFILPLGFGWPG